MSGGQTDFLETVSKRNQNRCVANALGKIFDLANGGIGTKLIKNSISSMLKTVLDIWFFLNLTDVYVSNSLINICQRSKISFKGLVRHQKILLNPKDINELSFCQIKQIIFDLFSFHIFTAEKIRPTLMLRCRIDQQPTGQVLRENLFHHVFGYLASACMTHQVLNFNINIEHFIIIDKNDFNLLARI